MFALLRLMAVGFVVLTVVYICLSLYSRSVRRGKLEAEWDTTHGTGDREETPERDAFIEEGLQDYDGSLRRKLIWGVYIIPMTLVTALIYFMNFH
ncbi:hypothetical protein [Shimia aestuarii]|uniref:Cation/multidrug efflux pump n=1 Tax=Shimia aestuarii TaxID=254406 RepID=A0A1I4MG70_9RHOB|nr:hypothetical protein [Shimia aestuarii]SFM02229.1 hypothetical protein SAMN04488042_10367 [Shimia aestuarii]